MTSTTASWFGRWMGGDWQQLSGLLKAYILLITVGGLIVLGWAIQSPQLVITTELVALLIISALLGPRTVRMGYTKGTRIELMISHPLTFTAILILSTPAAILVAETSLLVSLFTSQRATRRYRRWFNVAIFAITTAAGGEMFKLMASRADNLMSTRTIVALLAGVLSYYTVNTVGIAIAVALYNRASFSRVWHENFMWSAPSYVAGGSISLAVSYFILEFGIVSLILALPFCVLLYYSYKLYMDRLFEERKHSEEITRINLALENKVRDRTKELEELNRKLQDSNKELQRVSHLKSEFLANMSHELRTPLNAIIGFSELLIDRTFGELNDSQTDYVHDILSSGRHLLELINDILDLSKIEAGKMVLRIEPFEVGSAVSEAMTVLHVPASRKTIELAADVPHDLPLFSGDQGKFRQILNNLLSNAVKFTPEGGRVFLIVRSQDEGIKVSVVDTGIGINDEDQRRIFEAFMQVDGSYSRKYQGTGLGLTLVKKFVEMHGGELIVESTTNKGSMFSFYLPSAAPTADEFLLPAEPPKRPTDVHNNKRSGPTRDEPQIPDLPSIESFKASDHQILVVEDNPANMRLICDLLSSKGYSVAQAPTARTALDLAEKLSPDLIIMDIQLPDMDGLECTKTLKSNPRTTHIPTVALSAHVMKGDEQRARDAGCVGYIRKPIDTDQFPKQIARYIQSRESVTSKE
ncbi:MAG: ATP-binding protein [Acidobacteria bacterium]|nr:ATP-binding protein [Acidobacteriota bacterium]